MKTEKEFSDFFIESCQHDDRFHQQVLDIAKNYWLDLTAHMDQYFSNEDRLEITKKAAELLSQNLKSEDKDSAWTGVIRNFLQNNYWGFKSTVTKPERKKTEEQKIFWKLFKYVWAFIQSMLIIKTAVYFFGIEATSHPDQMSIGWMWLFFSISVASLAYFAYRNREDNE